MTISPRPISWGTWNPDLSDINTPFTQSTLNVIPRADGYMPWRAISEVTDPLPGPCRGFFFARSAGALLVFAGTETDLYLLDNSNFSWTNVSQGGIPYTALATDA